MEHFLDLQPMFVLHTRSYRETSLLIDLLTQKEGRICVIARGVKHSKAGSKNLIRPFIPLLASWRGRGELPYLMNVEAKGEILHLSGKSLLIGFYLNELLMRVLHRHDACTHIFALYERALRELNLKISHELLLRKFEKGLLQELGFGLNFTHDAETEETILPDAKYIYFKNKGFVLSDAKHDTRLFLGRHLISIAQDNYEEQEVLSVAKYLMRLSFAEILGDKPLKSRELWR